MPESCVDRSKNLLRRLRVATVDRGEACRDLLGCGILTPLLLNLRGRRRTDAVHVVATTVLLVFGKQLASAATVIELGEVRVLGENQRGHVVLPSMHRGS